MNLGVWDSRIKHQALEVLQKIVFHICWDYIDFGVIFVWFSMASGPIFRNLMIFDGFPEAPGAEGPLPEEGIWYTSWPPFQQPNSRSSY